MTTPMLPFIAVLSECITGSPTRKLVLLVLHSFSQRGKAWPAISSLARRCEVDNRTVRRALRELEYGQFIVRVERTSGGRGRTQEYRILIRPDADAERGADDPPFEPETRIVDAERGADDPPKAGMEMPANARGRARERAQRHDPVDDAHEDLLASYPNMRKRRAAKHKSSDVQRVPDHAETQRYLDELREARKRLRKEG